jgi:hypothetical protein
MVLHSCHNRLCVNVDHLRLGTHAENMRDRAEATRTAKGARHGMAKLNEAAVADLRHRAAMGAKLVDLAAEYGVSVSTVSLTVRGMRWAPSRPSTDAEKKAARESMRRVRARRAVSP